MFKEYIEGDMVDHLYMSILEHFIVGERWEEGEKEEGMMVRAKWLVEPHLMWGATVMDM